MGAAWEWVRRWEIRAEWERTSLGKGKVVQRIASTPSELRRLVEAARRNPSIISYRYASIRTLDGDEPTACRAGHTYPRGAGYRSTFTRWLVCCCGGHMQFTCPKCQDRRVLPEFAFDCDGTTREHERPPPRCGNGGRNLGLRRESRRAAARTTGTARRPATAT